MKYVYLCNGKACPKQCADLPPEEWKKHPCHHTTDERFAKNKIRRNRKFKRTFVKFNKDTMMEVE